MEPVLQGIRGMKGPELAVGNGGSTQAQHGRSHPATKLGKGVAAFDAAVALQVEVGEVLGQGAKRLAGAVGLGEHAGDLGLGVPIVTIDQRPLELDLAAVCITLRMSRRRSAQREGHLPASLAGRRSARCTG